MSLTATKVKFLNDSKVWRGRVKP